MTSWRPIWNCPFQLAIRVQPRTDEIADRCQVIELLDPRSDLCDEFDGLYCRTRKGKFLVNLPLVEMTVLPPNRNAQLLADYEYWFWHWRS